MHLRPIWPVRLTALALVAFLAIGCTGSRPAPSAATLTRAPAVQAVDSTANPSGVDETLPPEAVGSIVASEQVEGPPEIVEYAVPNGSHPHDVAPAPDGTVWYTAQQAGALGRLDPSTGATTQIPLGSGSAPHGVIVGPDGAAWVTDGGLNSIVRVDPTTEEITEFPLPPGSGYANLNTAVFDNRGVLWFTGQSGVYGKLDPDQGVVEVFAAPRGRGPYGIAVTPGGEVCYASLAGSYVGHIALNTDDVEILEPPTASQGARRVWSDSLGRLWISEWNAGQLAMHDPSTSAWREWRLPGDGPSPYAIYVDERDDVWLSDFGSNAILRFDPETETFASFPIPSPGAAVRQLLGRPGEVWGAESGTDKLILIKK